MSVEKVNKYKKEKKNRQEILKAQKRQKLIARILLSVAAVAVAAFLVVAVYKAIMKDQIGTNAQVVNIQALEDFVDGTDQ